MTVSYSHTCIVVEIIHFQDLVVIIGSTSNTLAIKEPSLFELFPSLAFDQIEINIRDSDLLSSLDFGCCHPYCNQEEVQPSTWKCL